MLEHGPVKRIVILVVECAEQDTEQLSQVHVVWGLVKAKPSAVVQVHGKFCWKALHGKKLQLQIILTD